MQSVISALNKEMLLKASSGSLTAENYQRMDSGGYRSTLRTVTEMERIKSALMSELYGQKRI
jgi:hypothetical protein